VIELQGIPTVTFCTVPFRVLVDARLKFLGLPDMPVVYLPHPMMTRSAEEIGEMADLVLQDVVRGLTGGTGG
jgi:hypothetical protein